LKVYLQETNKFLALFNYIPELKFGQKSWFEESLQEYYQKYIPHLLLSLQKLHKKLQKFKKTTEQLSNFMHGIYAIFCGAFSSSKIFMIKKLHEIFLCLTGRIQPSF